MRYWIKFSVCFMALITFSTFAKDNLGKREVLLSNDKVEVVRLTYPPGTESGMHTHIYPNRTVYFVKGGTLELVSDNASQASKIIEAPAGQLLYLPAMTHNVKNIGDTEVILIENEIKE